MFIRTKKINNKLYGYLVQSVWENEKTRQKVKKYLGAILPLEEKKETPTQFLEAKEYTNPKILLHDLFHSYITSIGFSKKETYYTTVIKGKTVCYHPEKQTLTFLNAKDAVVAVNEGFLCEYTLKDFFGFTKKTITEENQQDILKELAESVVACGMSIPPQEFANMCITLLQLQKAHVEE